MERRYWMIKVYTHCFQMMMMVYGTEQEMWAYLRPDFGGDERTTGSYSYYGATDEEVKTAKALGMKAYICPEIES